MSENIGDASATMPLRTWKLTPSLERMTMSAAGLLKGGFGSASLNEPVRSGIYIEESIKVVSMGV